MAALTVALLVTAAPAQKAPPGSPMEKKVLDAIDRGLKYLYRTQNADGTWDTKHLRQHPGGTASLVLLTALSAGADIQTPQLQRALAYIKGVSPETVYARALRAMAYARIPGNEYTVRTQADATWLVKQQRTTGGWGYGTAHPTTKLRGDWTDASNSQLAALALRDAANRGAPIPLEMWQRAMKYWDDSQNSDGGWGYEPPGKMGIRLRGSSYGSMTAAGAATFLIFAQTQGLIAGPAAGEDAAEPESLSEGLAWLAKNYAIDEIPKWSWGKREEWLYYYLFCFARVVEDSGRRTLNKHDIPKEITAFVLAHQRPDGSWDTAQGAGATGDSIHTCFALLTLLKASAPVMMDYVSLEGEPWRSGGVANFTQWFSQRLHRPATWRTLSATARSLPTDAPVLVIRSGRTFSPPKDLGPALKQYLQSGGTILFQPYGGDLTVAAAAEKYFLALLPGSRAADCASDHPVFSAGVKIAPETTPKLRGIGNKTRTRVFIAHQVVMGAWSRGFETTTAPAYSLGVNLLNYATDKNLPRTCFRAPPPEPVKPIETARHIPIARIQHKGDWNAYPRAFDRLNNVIAQSISVGVRATPKPVDLSDKIPQSLPLLWLTGSTPPDLSSLKLKELAEYLYGGGTLFVDAAVGTQEFADAVTTMLKGMFGEADLVVLGPDSPLLSGRFAGGLGGRIDTVEYTPAVNADRDDKLTKPHVMGVGIQGRLAVIFSPYGVTAPLEGNPPPGCKGLTTRDALRLAANVVLYAAVDKPLQTSSRKKNGSE